MAFPEFSNQEVSNLLMVCDNFESFDGTLISLRSPALALTLCPPLAPPMATGCCPNPFSRLLSGESGKGALFAAPKSFPDNSKARLHCKSKPYSHSQITDSLARSPSQIGAGNRSSPQSSQSKKPNASDACPNFLRGKIGAIALLWISLSPIQTSFSQRLCALCERPESSKSLLLN